MIAGRWLDLASLMITSADLVFSKASYKGSSATRHVGSNTFRYVGLEMVTSRYPSSPGGGDSSATSHSQNIISCSYSL
ncbi:hypothetical protein HanLR1_Chr02g0052021 [Helianthus annuus]|nr:hypothetical protein HanLR1_Chr10g0370591 [Helianthus annuus]KAJ0776985.1 hypothetical protein HanLR1_Chr02g0052021 [Helianthus annuus]